MYNKLGLIVSEQQNIILQLTSSQMYCTFRIMRFASTYEN